MSGHGGGKTKKLGWFLCWAIVFADIGTSLYYVPGILTGDVKSLAGIFVILSSIVFILLTLKFVEITDRYTDGGGVVTVATKAFGPWIGALGGMFLTVDYFLTASISAVSGFAYLDSIVDLGQFVIIGAIIGIILLGILNVIGIRESASVTAFAAIAAFTVDIVLVIFVISQLKQESWDLIFTNLGHISNLQPVEFLTGYAGSFLAFSGLASISQLSPAMQLPRKQVAGKAMIFVVLAVLFTSPLLTMFSSNLLNRVIPETNETILTSVTSIKHREEELAHTTDPEKRHELTHQIAIGKEYSERFISELGAQYGGDALKIAVVLTASLLLLFAANTAIIGAYHVFINLAQNNFLPKLIQHNNSKFGTPHWAVMLAVVPPMVIIFVTKGDLILLGQLYAFGLLGGFGLASTGLDIVRWREKQSLSPKFLIGIFTTLLVLLAWGTNLFAKPLATLFGGTITLVGMIIALLVHNYYQNHIQDVEEIKLAAKKYIKRGAILLPIDNEFDLEVVDYAAKYAKLNHRPIVVLFVREFADILQTTAAHISHDELAVSGIHKVSKLLTKRGVDYYLLYETTTNSANTINNLRHELNIDTTIVMPSTQSRLVNLFHGNKLNELINCSAGNVLVHPVQ